LSLQYSTCNLKFNLTKGYEILRLSSIQVLFSLSTFANGSLDELVFGEAWNEFILNSIFQEYCILETHFPSSLFYYLLMLLENQKKLKFNKNWVLKFLSPEIVEKIRSQHLESPEGIIEILLEKLRENGFNIERIQSLDEKIEKNLELCFIQVGQTWLIENYINEVNKFY
jgi:hypothetical protein